MAEVFALAEEEILIGFAMIGIKGKAVADHDDALATFQGIVNDRRCVLEKETVDLSDCKMLIMSEDVSDMIGDELVAWQLSGSFPLVVEIPPLAGSSAAHTGIVDAVRQAIGFKIE